MHNLVVGLNIYSLGQMGAETKEPFGQADYLFTVNKCIHVYDLLTTIVCGENLGHYSPSTGIISMG